jgi:PAS domain S-box-containing protein
VNISALGNDAIGIVTLIVLAAAMVTSSVDRRAAVEVQRLNQALERRVAERTSQLEAVNQALRNEVAERERAEESVRASEDRLRLVIDTAPVMLHSARPDGYVDFFNKRWLEYVGVSLEDIRGWQWTYVIHSEDVAHVLGKWRSSVATGKPFEAEARLRRADGEYRLMLLRKVPLRDEAENIVKWYGSATDIEDRRRAEEQLRQAQEDLARVTRVVAMGELAAIAHEVNQPLTAIVTNASLSLRQLNSATPDPDELRGAITEIVNDGARASAVLSRIRALLMSGAPSATEIDINQVIQDVILLLRYELNRNRISLRTEPAPDLPPVRGDPVQLQQVLINLIMNAIDALRKSGERPREILIRSAKNPEGILVQVEDSGPGIGPEQADRIFEPFFTTKPQGMGMGLSISRSIVESHGGRLWAAPGELHGARFQFIVPMADISNE